jgi:hypothetical protein
MLSFLRYFHKFFVQQSNAVLISVVVNKKHIQATSVADPEKNLFRIPDPGVKKAPDPGSGSATLEKFGSGINIQDPQHCQQQQEESNNEGDSNSRKTNKTRVT